MIVPTAGPEKLIDASLGLCLHSGVGRPSYELLTQDGQAETPATSSHLATSRMGPVADFFFDPPDCSEERSRIVSVTI